jgi:hypothetical protein
MNRGSCLNCGDPLPEWSRADRRTCSVRCRVARQRQAGAAKPQPPGVRNTPALDDTATGLVAVTSALSESRPAGVLIGVTAQDALLRLSSWLADVSAEAATEAATEAEAS